jgi:hypothetical protein
LSPSLNPEPARRTRMGGAHCHPSLSFSYLAMGRQTGTGTLAALETRSEADSADRRTPMSILKMPTLKEMNRHIHLLLSLRWPFSGSLLRSNAPSSCSILRGDCPDREALPGGGLGSCRSRQLGRRWNSQALSRSRLQSRQECRCSGSTSTAGEVEPCPPSTSPPAGNSSATPARRGGG